MEPNPSVPPPAYDKVAEARRPSLDEDRKTASANPLALDAGSASSAVASSSTEGAASGPSKAFVIQLRLHKPRLQYQRIHIDPSTLLGLQNTVFSLQPSTTYDRLRDDIRRLIVSSNFANRDVDAADTQYYHQLRVWLLRDSTHLQDGTRLQDADVMGQSYFDVSEANWDAAKQILFGDAQVAVRLGFMMLPKGGKDDEETFRLWREKHAEAPLRVVPTVREKRKSKKEGCLQQ